MKVKDAMTKDVITVSPDDSLENIVDVFSENRISGAPIVKDGKIVGVLSESDIIRKLDIKSVVSLKNHKDAEVIKAAIQDPNLKVSEIMKKDVCSVYEDDDIIEAIKIMHREDVNRLPVLNKKGTLSGILTRGDVIRAFARKGAPLDKKVLGVLETEVDKLLKIIDKKGFVTVDTLAKMLNIGKEKVEEWGKVLEEHGLITIEYSPIGKTIFKKR